MIATRGTTDLTRLRYERDDAFTEYLTVTERAGALRQQGYDLAPLRDRINEARTAYERAETALEGALEVIR